MKTTNLLIIGGAVALGGIYIINKGNKSKADAKALALADAQLKAEKDKEQEKINADKVLADAKIKAEKDKEEIANHYTLAEAGIKALETITKTNTLFTANPIKIVLNPIKGNSVTVFNTTLIIPSISIDNLNLFYKNQDELKTRDVWTKNYSSIYKDIKDYYYSIRKEEVDKIQDVLPKLIVAKSMDNFGSRGKLILTAEDEIYLMDNNLDKEDVLKNALKTNYHLLFQTNPILNTDISKRILIESAIYGERNNVSDIKNIVNGLIKKGTYSFIATNNLFGGDPSQGNPKYVMINYSIDGNKIPLSVFNSSTNDFRGDIDGVREGQLVTLIK